MDTEEERPDIVDDGTQAEVNALRNLLSQLGDPDAAHEAGVIDDDSYIEQKAKKYYDRPLWSKARVHKAVECKWITADEYKEITGEEYTAE